jgi:hypothetical protein
VRVAAPQGQTARGSFSLSVTNLDAFAASDRATLLFPAGDGPGQVVMEDLNHDDVNDLVVSNALSDTVSVLLGNGDGSFQAPRQFAVGAFVAGIESTISVLHNGRGVVLADFNGDANPDIAVTNKDSADVSVLLGRGDGTFEPQRRFDATSRPFSIDAGDLNGDSIPDLAVMDDLLNHSLTVAVLLGRGDGTFRHQNLIDTGVNGSAGVAKIRIADVNNDRRADIVFAGTTNQESHVWLGNGDGTFQAAGKFAGGGPGLALVDLNNDGNLDAVNASIYNNTVGFSLGNGDGTFGPTATFFGGLSPVSVEVADLASVDAAGNVIVGAPDGIPDIVSAGSGAPQVVFQGSPEVMLSAGVISRTGTLSYMNAVRLASGDEPISVAVGDVNGDGSKEVVFVDQPGVRVFFARPPALTPNTTRDAARDLGTVVDLLEPTLTIIPGREAAWYALTVPTEAAHGSGDEIVDFSGLFAHQRGPGLDMQVLDGDGNVLGAGEHVRVRAKQGQRLYVHVFARTDATGGRGSGAYTLDIAVLPQLVSVEGQSLLPGAGANRSGGPTATLVLTFQGDRLDPAQAENPANYRVIHLEGNREILIDAGDAQAAVYNPSANVDVGSGKQYPTAVRQTVTLLFDTPLPAGSYRIEVSNNVQAVPFNESERALIGDRHPVVGFAPDGQIVEGATFTGEGIVAPVSSVGDFSVFESGTPFLSQLHSDLGAILDRLLTADGDREGITKVLLDQMRVRLAAGLTTRNGIATPLVAVFLDPVGIDLQDPSGDRVTYDLGSGALDNSIANAFVSVASNVELIIVPMAAGQFTLNIDDVPATARGGAVLLGPDGDATLSFTESMRDGQRRFTFGLAGEQLDLPDGHVGGGVASRTADMTAIAGLTGSDEIVTFASAVAGSSTSAFAAAGTTPSAEGRFGALQTFDDIAYGGGETRPADGLGDEAENQRLFRWWAELNRRFGLTLPWLTQPALPSLPDSRAPEPEAPPQPQQQPNPQRTTDAQPTSSQQPRDQVRDDAPSSPVSRANDDTSQDRPYASLALLPLWLCRRSLVRRRHRRHRPRGEEGDA